MRTNKGAVEKYNMKVVKRKLSHNESDAFEVTMEEEQIHWTSRTPAPFFGRREGKYCTDDATKE